MIKQHVSAGQRYRAENTDMQVSRASAVETGLNMIVCAASTADCSRACSLAFSTIKLSVSRLSIPADQTQEPRLVGLLQAGGRRTPQQGYNSVDLDTAACEKVHAPAYIMISSGPGIREQCKMRSWQARPRMS